MRHAEGNSSHQDRDDRSVSVLDRPLHVATERRLFNHAGDDRTHENPQQHRRVG
jgi:hypothetical protein